MLKLVILIVVLYFIARSIGNMVKAVLHDPKAAPSVPPPPPRRQEREPQWNGPASGTARGSDVDIEDAKWVDLD